MNYKKTYQSLPISTSAIIRLKGLWFASSKGNFQTFELHHSTVSIFFTSGKPLASHFVCGHCSKLASTITPLYMSFSLSSLMLSLNHSTWAVCLILVLISNLVQVDLCQWNINIFNSATSRFALSFSQCHCLQIIHRSRLHYLPLHSCSYKSFISSSDTCLHLLHLHALLYFFWCSVALDGWPQLLSLLSLHLHCYTCFPLIYTRLALLTFIPLFFRAYLHLSCLSQSWPLR